MIYIASPYSDPDPQVRRLRYEAVFAYSRMLFLQDHVNFSPIVYGHQYATRESFPYDAAFWWEFNKQMLAASTSVDILMLDGWQGSCGVNKELRLAKELELTVNYATPDGVLTRA